ncbi:MAG TPA: ABC transporter substrate-binding protein [Stellaceae bacterium]|jgi:phospholipid transport system substrate-binding protein|nr:ABC transporter substrate-binding protein [Stellaceae bacterium]
MLRCRKYLFPRLAVSGLLLSGWLVLFSPIPAQGAPGPTEVIRQFCGQLLDVMQHATALGARGRYQRLEPIVLGAFDLPFMARLSTGPSWAKLSTDQKRRVAQAYGRYTTAVYATRFDGYSGERFEFLGEQKIKRGTMVKTRIIKANGEPVSINFVLHDNDIAWQIRDVYLDSAISELATRRSEFSALLRSGGIDALIASLNKKADDLQT